MLRPLQPGLPRLLLFFTLLKAAIRRSLPLGETLRRLSTESDLPAADLLAMAHEIDDGRSLGKAMESRPDLFPPPLAALMMAGEAAGNPLPAVEQCLEQVRRSVRTGRHIQAALVYPGICLALAMVMMILLGFLQNPATLQSSLFSAVDQDPGEPVIKLRASPPAPQAVPRWRWEVLASPFLRAVLVLLPIGLFIAVWVLFRGERTPRRDRAILNLPVVGRLFRWSAAAAFSRSLGGMLASGVAVDRAVDQSIPSAGNAWVESMLRERLANVRDGGSLVASLTLPGIFPPSFAWRLAAVEGGREPGQVLLEAAASFEEEAEAGAERLIRSAEPLAMVLVGAIAIVVTFLYLSPMRYLNELFSSFAILS